KRAALHYIPEEAIQFLLRLASDRTETFPHGDPDIKLIGEWVASSPTESALRRKVLCDGIAAWFKGGGSSATAMQALPHVLSTGFQRTEMDPIEQNRFTFEQGNISFEQAKDVQSLWPAIRDFVVRFADPCCLIALVDHWARAGGPNRKKLPD